MESECLEERNYLVKLTKYFKELFMNLVQTTNLNENKDMMELKDFYEEMTNKLLDKDYFICISGRNIEDEIQSNLGQVNNYL
jgi:hypothetical protein